jgi:glycosyltransferase involved in cell wall biosynthesis
VEGRLHFVDFVPHDQVVDFIRTVDLGICAINPKTKSYYYSLPNKVLEMSMAGLPIIATDLPEIRGFLNEVGNGYLFSHKEPEKISSLVNVVLNDLKDRKVDKSRILSLSRNHSWENESKKTINIIYEITKTTT